MELRRRLPRKPFVALALAAILGIGAAEWLPLRPLFLLIPCAIIAVVILLRPRPSLCWLLTALTFALLHTLRYEESPARRFAATLVQPQTVEVEGVVASEPNVFTDGRGFPGATCWLRIEGGFGIPGSLCLLRWRGEAPAYGDRIRLRGTASQHEPPRNPGSFDAATWLSRQGVHFQLLLESPENAKILGHGAGNALRQSALQTRTWIKTQLDRGLPEDPVIATLISSMILGLKGETPPDLKELFQETGTLHLFAVSGLNVGMLVIIAWALLRPFRVGPKLGALLIIPILASYALVVGLSASCVRATIVACFLLASAWFERDAIPFNSLAAAAFAILAWETNELFNPGFQLSFFLVAAIMACAEPFQKRAESIAQPDEFLPQDLWSRSDHLRIRVARAAGINLGVAVATWVGSLPFMLGYFHLVSPVGFIANFFAVPIAFFILAFGLFSLLASAFHLVSTAIVVNHANWAAAKLLIFTVESFAKVPSGHLYAEWPTLSPTPACEIVALDVGEGAAIHVRTPEGNWLVDAGHLRDYPRTILPYLRSRGIDRLDGLILSHGDTAHLGGAVPLLKDFAPRWIADTPLLDRSGTRRSVHAELARMELGRRLPFRGERFPLDSGADVQVLYPPPDWPRASADDKGLVFRLEIAGARILFVSDIGFPVEQWLLQNEPDLRADILIKGWPNNDLSGTPDFIAKVAPSAIICASPKFGTTDTSAWITPLAKRGIRVYPQSECGAVRMQVEADGRISIQSWKSPANR